MHPDSRSRNVKKNPRSIRRKTPRSVAKKKTSRRRVRRTSVKKRKIASNLKGGATTATTAGAPTTSMEKRGAPAAPEQGLDRGAGLPEAPAAPEQGLGWGAGWPEEVSIEGTDKTDNSGKTYYIIHVKVSMEHEYGVMEHEYKVKKRYSDFAQLNEDLATAWPSTSTPKPKFPEWTLRKCDTTCESTRVVELDVWLKGALAAFKHTSNTARDLLFGEKNSFLADPAHREESPEVAAGEGPFKRMFRRLLPQHIKDWDFFQAQLKRLELIYRIFNEDTVKEGNLQLLYTGKQMQQIKILFFLTSLLLRKLKQELKDWQILVVAVGSEKLKNAFMYFLEMINEKIELLKKFDTKYNIQFSKTFSNIPSEQGAPANEKFSVKVVHLSKTELAQAIRNILMELGLRESLTAKEKEATMNQLATYIKGGNAYTPK